MKKIILILLPLLFQVACLGANEDYLDSISSVPSNGGLVIAAKEEAKPAFNCSKDRLDPVKTLQRASYLNDEKVVYYDCQLETYCIKRNYQNLGDVCWPYLNFKNDFESNHYPSHEFDEQLQLIYSKKLYQTVEWPEEIGPIFYSGSYSKNYPLTIGKLEGGAELLYKF